VVAVQVTRIGLGLAQTPRCGPGHTAATANSLAALTFCSTATRPQRTVPTRSSVTAPGRGCVETRSEQKFMGTRPLARLAIVDPRSIYEVVPEPECAREEFSHSLGRIRTSAVAVARGCLRCPAVNNSGTSNLDLCSTDFRSCQQNVQIGWICSSTWAPADVRWEGPQPSNRTHAP
jgi:hypothetical protein